MRFILPKFFFNCERWKWNDDLRIYVSTHGHVKDEYKKNVAAKINGNGYFVVRVNDRFYTIHRLVLMTWRPLPNDGTPMTVDHLDSNRRNNRLDNLEWVSQEENLRRANEIFTNDKKAMTCENCQNFKPLSKHTEVVPLPPVVTWQDMKEKYGLYQNKIQGQYWPEDLTEKLKELWESGQVKIYRGSSSVEITKEYFKEKIKNMSDRDLLTERFLRHSLERRGRYLGMNPYMRWSK